MQSEEKAETPRETPENETDADAVSANETPDAEASEATDGADSEAPEAAAAGAEAGSVEAELAETKDKLLRALAEAENVRRRAARDVENASKRAFSGFAREMIVVADNLARALDAVDAKAVAENDSLKNLLTGIEMTAREMDNVFGRNNIQKMNPLGEKFDPQMHEAMFEYDDPSKPAGTIGQVMEVGYALHGQPLRPAKVGVTKGGPKAEAAPEGRAPTPTDQVLKDSAKSSGGETAYEDGGKPSGSQLDEEL